MKLNITKKILAAGLGVVLVGAVGFAAASVSAGNGVLSGGRNNSQVTATGGEMRGRGQASAQQPGDCQGDGRNNTRRGKSQGEGRGQNKNNAQRSARSAGHSVQGNQSNGQMRGNGNGARGQGNGQGRLSNGSHQAVPADQWVAVSGKVTLFSGNELTLRTNSGEMVVDLGPIWYWDTHGIDLTQGDNVTLKGFYADEFEPGQVLDQTTGASVTLRSNEGMPLWVGGQK